jgi:hypothetical protein
LHAEILILKKNPPYGAYIPDERYKMLKFPAGYTVCTGTGNPKTSIPVKFRIMVRTPVKK